MGRGVRGWALGGGIHDAQCGRPELKPWDNGKVARIYDFDTWHAYATERIQTLKMLGSS